MPLQLEPSWGIHVCVCVWLGGYFFLFAAETACSKGETLPEVGAGRTQVQLLCEGHRLRVGPVQKLLIQRVLTVRSRWCQRTRRINQPR